jgi:hypothetical protein
VKHQQARLDTTEDRRVESTGHHKTTVRDQRLASSLLPPPQDQRSLGHVKALQVRVLGWIG